MVRNVTTLGGLLYRGKSRRNRTKDHRKTFGLSITNPRQRTTRGPLFLLMIRPRGKAIMFLNSPNDPRRVIFRLLPNIYNIRRRGNGLRRPFVPTLRNL